MYESILRFSTELATKICFRAEKGEIRDLDVMADEILKDCKETSREILKEIIQHMNESLRKDKQARKEMGLVIKEKDRPRSLLTAIGQIDFARDYFFDKENASFVSVLDQMLGIAKYERIGASVSAGLVTQATDTSYAKSANIVTGGEVSRQTVHNQIRNMETPEIEIESEKRDVKELHLHADEDHAHMQKPNKEKGKQGKIIPLVTVTEGTEEESKGRNRTINPVHFSDEQFDTKRLWKSVEGFICKHYEPCKLNKIYIHGDGGPWIQGGLSDLPQTVHVMDGFHFYKELRKISRILPHRHVRVALTNAVKYDNKERADEYIQDILGEDSLTEKDAENIRKFAIYLMGNWKEIRRRLTEEGIPGSCTEGLISSVLSERFSRDPLGWSEKNLGKLVMARIYRKNGGRIAKKHFRKGDEVKEKYSEYADRFIEENIKGAVDFSMFEAERPILDVASGTQVKIRGIGMTRDILIN